MRAVKGGLGSVEQKSNPGAISLIPLSPHGHEQRLDVIPWNIGPNGIGKDGFQGFAVFAIHVYLVS